MDLEWRFQVYDTIGIILVGSFGLILIDRAFPPLAGLWSVGSEFEKGLTLLVLAYTLGNFMQNASRLVLPKSWRPSFLKRATFDNMLSESERSAVLSAVKEFYGLPDVKPSSLEHLCIAPVYDRMSKRDVFVALADYNRSMAAVSFVASLMLLVRAVMSGFHSVLVLLGAVVSAGMGCVFLSSYMGFARLGALVVYSAFLSWWKEEELKRKP